MLHCLNSTMPHLSTYFTDLLFISTWYTGDLSKLYIRVNRAKMKMLPPIFRSLNTGNVEFQLSVLFDGSLRKTRFSLSVCRHLGIKWIARFLHLETNSHTESLPHGGSQYRHCILWGWSVLPFSLHGHYFQPLAHYELKSCSKKLTGFEEWGQRDACKYCCHCIIRRRP